MSYLVYHEPSDFLFRVSTEEELKEALSNLECADVTDMPFYEKAYTEQKEKEKTMGFFDNIKNIMEEEALKKGKQQTFLEGYKREPAKPIKVHRPVPKKLLDLGNGDMVELRDEQVTVDAVEAIKQRAISTALEIGLKMGTWPLHLMQTPKGRTVGFPFPTPRQGQLEAVDDCITIIESGNNCLLEAATGCHAKGQGILMHDGSIKKVEDIVVGDHLMGPDSKPRLVDNLARGRQEMYEIRPVKGDPFIVNKDHILTLVCIGRNTNDPKKGTLVDVSVANWLKWNKTQKHIHKLLRVGVDFSKKDLPIKPYWLGIYLGDGSKSKCEITKPDREIIEEVKNICKFYNLQYSSPDGLHHSFSTGVHGGKHDRNRFINDMRSLGIWLNKGGDLYIPQIYKTSGENDRLEILAGLLDTDGNLTNNCYDFISKSERLSDDVIYIARSLGFAAYKKSCTKSCQNNFSGLYHRVSISGDLSKIPMRIPRKKSSGRKQIKDVLHTGFTATPVGVDDYYGFHIDGDNRYLLDDFTVTHNTGKSAVAVAVASYFKSSWLLVGRNDLVDQWEGDFSNFAAIGFYKSRARFTCVNALKVPGKVFTCADTKECSAGKAAIEKGLSDWGEASRKHAADPTKHPKPGPMPSGEKPCPYACNRDLALTKDHTACTLALGLTAFKHMNAYPPVKPRRLLVVDECSELESELIKFHTCTISTKTLARGLGNSTWEELGMDIPPAVPGDGFLKVLISSPDPETAILGYLEHFRPANLEEAQMWALIAQDALERVVKVLEEQTFEVSTNMKRLDGTISPEDQKQLDELNAENDENIKDCNSIIKQVATAHEAMVGKLPYCHENTEPKNGHWQMILKPLEARGLFDRLMAAYGQSFLFVSATTGTAEGFRSAHGMKEPLQRIEIPSPFPVQNRPVIFMPSANMSKKTYDTDLPVMLDAIEALVKQADPNGWRDHRNQRGIIHTYTSRLTRSIYEHLNKRGQGHRAVILEGGGRFREEAMNTFRAIPNGILISPSAMLGLSLNDDLARWQIIAKVPYAYLGDKSVEHRKDVIPGWYEWQTVKDLIQTMGRIVRSKDDWGYTYILDECFSNVYRYNSGLFPQYVKEAFHGV